MGVGNPKLIFDECWGIVGTEDGGAVIACGTGIEGCEEWPEQSEIRAKCVSDPRLTWRGLVIKIDMNGDEEWHRVDSYSFTGEETLEVSTSASEYVGITAEGKFFSVVDQEFGIGFILFGKLQ